MSARLCHLEFCEGCGAKVTGIAQRRATTVTERALMHSAAMQRQLKQRRNLSQRRNPSQQRAQRLAVFLPPQPTRALAALSLSQRCS